MKAKKFVPWPLLTSNFQICNVCVYANRKALLLYVNDNRARDMHWYSDNFLIFSSSQLCAGFHDIFTGKVNNEQYDRVLNSAENKPYADLILACMKFKRPGGSAEFKNIALAETKMICPFLPATVSTTSKNGIFSTKTRSLFDWISDSMQYFRPADLQSTIKPL